MKLSIYQFSFLQYAHYPDRGEWLDGEISRIASENSLPEINARDIELKVTRDLQSVFTLHDIRDERDRRVMNKWDVYGSFRNGLCCKDSDIDFHNGN